MLAFESSLYRAVGLHRYGADLIVARISSLPGLHRYADFIVTWASSLCGLHCYSDLVVTSTQLECQHRALYVQITILTYSGLQTVIRNSVNKKGKIEDKILRIQVNVSFNALNDEDESFISNNINSFARQIFYEFELVNFKVQSCISMQRLHSLFLLYIYKIIQSFKESTNAKNTAQVNSYSVIFALTFQNVVECCLFILTCEQLQLLITLRLLFVLFILLSLTVSSMTLQNHSRKRK